MRQIPTDAAQDQGVDFSMPAPITGWNARDSIAMMRSTDAIALDNWFPGATSVDVRPGSAANATVPSGSSVESLLGLAKRDGTFKRFAAASTGIYDISAGGAIAAVSSACTVGKWEYTQINVGGISYLWCCAGDGANDSRVYKSDTDTWINLTGVSVPALTGLTSNLVANVSLFKYRLILCYKDSMSFYYGPLNSVGGAFSEFDLGQVFKKGGYLVATANWTVDAGDGADDRFVAITSEGEIAVYQGTDPSSATDFSLVGVYQVGKPIGKRCFIQIAGDLGVLTEQGLWPLSKALESSTVDRRVALTDKIQSAFNTYYKSFGAQYGWQAVLLSKGPAVIVNVPYSAGLSYQFVMNTITGAWCRFTGWGATCLLVLDGKLYFAANNTILEGWTGEADVEAGITATSVCAFTSGPSRRKGKKVNLVRPIMVATAPVTLTLALDTDYQTRTSMGTTLSSSDSSSLWDTALFDLAIWSGGLTMVNRWKAVKHKPGKVFSLRLRAQVKNIALSWSSTDFITESTGLLQ